MLAAGLGRITARILLLLLPYAVAEEEEEELTLYQHNTQYTLLKGGGRAGPGEARHTRNRDRNRTPLTSLSTRDKMFLRAANAPL